MQLNQHKQPKSKALSYLHGIGITRPKTETEALSLLLDIHKRFRARDDERLQKIAQLPAWKRWILFILNIQL